jgi:hypothetical protein
VNLPTLIAACALVALCGGCGRPAETPEAVRQAVIDHVSTRVNLASMDVNVSAVSFKGETAEATVEFRPKDGTGGPGIQMNYTLERQGSKWSVKSKSDAGGSPHGGGMMPGQQLPPGHPPTTGEPASRGEKAQ